MGSSNVTSGAYQDVTIGLKKVMYSFDSTLFSLEIVADKSFVCKVVEEASVVDIVSGLNEERCSSDGALCATSLDGEMENAVVSPTPTTRKRNKDAEEKNFMMIVLWLLWQFRFIVCGWFRLRRLCLCLAESVEVLRLTKFKRTHATTTNPIFHHHSPHSTPETHSKASHRG